MKAHHAINRLIASATLQSYKEGGEVKTPPRLRESKKRFRERAAGFLGKLTEKSRFLDKLYYSPEESYEDVFGGANLMAFGVLPGEQHAEDRGELTSIRPEGMKELWRQAGSPFVRMHGDERRYGAYMPSGAEWHYAKKTPRALLDKLLNVDTMYVPQDVFGHGGSKDIGISELAHALRFADPAKYSKYKSRKELLLGKGQEHAEQELYYTPGTDEYQTHSVVEPQLRDWLIKNYAFDWNE